MMTPADVLILVLILLVCFSVEMIASRLVDALPPLPECVIFESSPKYTTGRWVPREGSRKKMPGI